jgi:hypothetical protein
MMTDPMEVTIYSKANCSLCDDLMADLVWLQQELGFIIKSQDINADEKFKQKFQYLVPVLEIGGAFYNPPHDLLQTRQRIIAATRDGVEN